MAPTALTDSVDQAVIGIAKALDKMAENADKLVDILFGPAAWSSYEIWSITLKIIKNVAALLWLYNENRWAVPTYADQKKKLSSQMDVFLKGRPEARNELQNLVANCLARAALVKHHPEARVNDEETPVAVPEQDNQDANADPNDRNDPAGRNDPIDEI
jgi:hypothetical protein